jgi:hypothetical protein
MHRVQARDTHSGSSVTHAQNQLPEWKRQQACFSEHGQRECLRA